MRVKLEWILGESKRREEERREERERQRIKGIRITVTQKGTGTIYNILIILDFLFQLLQTDKET